jgi:hypothetical protein
MTDRPIIFSAPMIRALLDGRKTQTRRLLKPQPFISGYHNGGVSLDKVGDEYARFSAMAVGASAIIEHVVTIPYAIGDRLYVRESIARQETDQGVGYQTYAADGSNVWPLTQWYHQRKSIPSIHMPRWASRLTLTVTDVREQRLQEISEDDAWAEGCERGEPNDAGGNFPAEVSCEVGTVGWDDAHDWYADLWDSLHGPEAWGANPWVVAVSFSVKRGNIDQIGGDA